MRNRMRNIMNLSIIVPARNEEKIIIKTLEALNSKVNIPHEIIVVDDFSTDKTSEIVSFYIKKNNNIRLYKTSSKKVGFSNAILLGIKNTKTKIIVIVMADLCDDPKIIDKMFTLINQGWDVVCGSRYIVEGSKIGGPKLQGFFSSFVCYSLYYLLNLPTHDVSNAFKMYKKKVLTSLKFNPARGLELSMDLTLQAFFKGYKITEVPTKWKGRTVGSSKFRLMKTAPSFLKIYFFALINSFKNTL